MEINIWIVFGILFLHWIFDFVLQSDEDAKGKSTSIKHLLNHTSIYSILWFNICILYVAYTGQYQMFLFAPITFLIHTITDYYTSKLNKYLWERGDSHNFFVSVGFDQWLHTLQLLLTYKLLI